MKYLEGLNPRQQEAVEHTDGPLLVLAGAGSGKTRVITHRIAYLIEEKGVPPANILAITFTNKAAAEMRERVDRLINSPVSKRVWVSTFHSTCVRILRRDADKIDYDPNFAIYDTKDQEALVKECLSELNINDKSFPPRSIMAEISRAKDNLLAPEDYSREVRGDFRKEIIARVYEKYQEKLVKNNGMDFGDLIFNTIVLLTLRSDVLEYYQNRFKYILVDEYQDTNYAQYVLVSKLAQKHRNLFVVGDDDQSIYQWRGADVKNILEFEKDYPEVNVVKLEQNYRSTKNILEAANNIIKHNIFRKDKTLWTENPEGEKLKVYKALDERDEARFIAFKIKEMIREEGKDYSDFALLYRTNVQSRVLEEVFMQEGLPYRLVGATQFYQRMEIKDLMAYLRVISNPADDFSLNRIINTPRRGIGRTTIQALLDFARRYNTSLYEALVRYKENRHLSSKVHKNLKGFIELMEGLKQQKDELGVVELIDLVLKNTGYLSELERQNTPESRSRIENLQEFKSVAYEFEKQNPGQGLEEFLAHVSLVTDADTIDERENAVLMMTMHSAKGLEFPVVFITGLEEGIFPHNRCLLEESELEEERRLCYVAVTRAKEKLFLTHAMTRTIYGSQKYNAPSRFLTEIPEELQEEAAFESAFEKESEFSPGDPVYHSKFGKGTIEGIEYGKTTRIKVYFPGLGIKTLDLRFAPLQKI